MERHKIIKGLAVLAMVLAIVGIAAGGIAYAMTSASRAETEQENQTNQTALAASVDEEDGDRGIVIAAVASDSPAAEAGLVRGDILLAIDGEPVDDFTDLQRHLATLEADDVVALTVLHGDEERTLTATLDERDGKPYLGATPCVGFPFAERLPVLPAKTGAMITRVSPDSPADAAGLQEGDRIVAVDGQEIDGEHSLADLITAHEPGDAVNLKVERPGEEPFDLTVPLGEHPDKAGVAYLGVEYLPFPQVRVLEGEGFDWEELPFNTPPFNEAPFRGEPFVIPLEGELGQGAVIRRVVEGGPADEAGLKEGDRIIAVDGQEIDAENSLADLVAARAPGETMVLEIEREGEDPFELTVRLGEHPENEGVAYLGVEYLPFPRIKAFEGEAIPFEGPHLDELPFSGKPFDLLPHEDIKQGVFIQHVDEGSPAEVAGLREGDVITEIGGEPVASPQDLADAIAALQPGGEITLTVYSADDEQARQVTVTLAEHPDKQGQPYLGVTIGAFFRSWRSDDAESPGWNGPLGEFLDELRNRWPFDGDDGPRFDFDFDFPPELFEELPCCPGESTA